MVRGLGYMLCRILVKSPDPDGTMVTIVGMIAWVALIPLAILGYRWMF